VGSVPAQGPKLAKVYGWPGDRLLLLSPRVRHTQEARDVWLAPC
jgi:hypothetical protein